MCFPELCKEMLPPPSLEAGTVDVKFANVTTGSWASPSRDPVSPSVLGTLMEQALELGARFEFCCQFSSSSVSLVLSW